MKQRPDRAIRAALLLGLLWASSVQAFQFHVRADLTEGAPPGKTVEGVLVLEPVTENKSELPTSRRLPFTIPGEKQLDLPGAAWKARIEAEGYWSESRPLKGDKEPGLQIWLIPLGRIRGTLGLPTGTKAVPEVGVRVRSTPRPGAPELVDSLVTCPVTAGKLDCAVPSGLLDLRFRREPLAPAYAWSVQVPAGGAADLGTVQLRPGASVSGWLETVDGKPIPPECRVELAPDSSEATGERGDDPMLNGMVLETRVNDRGFFQLIGVPPGAYVLTARAPGYAPARVAPLQVRPELEAQVLDRLVLARPVSVEIRIDPPREPYGAAWKVQLLRKASLSDPPLETLQCQPSRDEGACRVGNVVPGSYELLVLGEHGDRWHDEMIDVGPDSSLLEVRIPLVEIRGTVVRGEELVAATVWLVRDGRSLRFDADEKGRFEGLVPVEGLWDVDLLAGGERERMLLAPVEVKVPDGKSYAPVEVRIPDTTLVCEVVDDAGRPVPGADVIVAAQRARPTRERQIQNSSHQTGPTGEVTVKGLPPGPITLMASKDERKSEWAQAELVDGSEGSPVRLTLHSLKSIEGRISSGGGGVPGAMVMAWPPFQGLGANHLAQDVAGPTGAFHLSVPQDTSVLNVLVFPPGHALRMLTLTVAPGSPLEIPVDPSSGTLVLDLGTGNGPMPLLVHNGVFVSLQFLKPWIRMQSARQDDPRKLVLSAMEPGVYSLCGGAPVVGALTEGKAPPAASCSTGVLAAHSELVLRNP